jgi:hypothetical protein
LRKASKGQIRPLVKRFRQFPARWPKGWWIMDLGGALTFSPENEIHYITLKFIETSFMV